ncbi:oligosaccharide flippase family protein [bacterium]|nr:oligosaccharide flippase family protein [bacterium]MBU1958616.1 oligosaccharide flippase family protein [bacterium]
MILRKNIIANYAGKLYTILIGIVVLPFYLELLGAEAYGLVGFFVLMQSWMALLDIGMSPTLSREVAKLKGSNNIKDRESFKSLLHSLEFIFIGISLVVSLGIVLFNDWLSSTWLNVETLDLATVSYCIVLMGIMVGIRFLSTLYKSGIVGAEEQVWLNVVNVLIATLKFVGVLCILYFISNDVQYFFEYQIIVAFLEFFIFFIKFYKIVKIGKFKLYFSYNAIKPIIPFAGGIAFTTAIWIIMTQLDKTLLSHYLPLKEYGYFVIVAVVANAIMQLVDPVSQAILPRMTNLLAKKQDAEMIRVYKKSTQLMAVFIFSVVGIVGIFSYELLYSWTGDKEVSIWSQDILFWYVLGNGITAISAFQYYLQFAYGELKMHVQYNILLAVISIPLISWAAYTYGAIGVALVWFSLSLVSFLFWVPLVHHKFAPGMHKDWILKDILPIFLSTLLFLTVVHYIDLDFNHSRIIIFSILCLLGVLLLIMNACVSSEGRKLILTFLASYRKDKKK